MKHKLLNGAVGLTVIASTAWIPSQKVGAVPFTSPPDNIAPSESTGGASRGGLFVPKPGESNINRRATGGASRGSLFTPKPGESNINRRATGGASRGLFSPGSRQPIRQEGVSSGASRDGRRYLNYPYTNLEQPAAILALLPQSYFGTTVAQHAEILVYVPQSQARESVFSLKDAQGNTLHEMNVPISGQAEVISIKVPTELKLEKDYQWFLALKIDGELSTRTPYVDGWIKRIRPNQEIAASMQQGDLLKQAKAFGKHGVWYDCVSALAKLKATQPNNSSLNKHWSELLESVGLEKIEKAPVVATNYGF